jgi:hypothetical protein
MREKRIFVLLILLGLVLSFACSVSAIDTSGIQNTADKISGATDNIQGVQKVLTQDEARKEYLKQQWGDLFRNENSSVGKFFSPVVRGYDKVSPYSNPTFQFFVGMAPQLSLFFILVLVIWCTLVRYYFTIYTAINDISLFSPLTNGIIFFLTFVVLMVVQFFQSVSFFFASKIIDLIGLLTSTAMQIIVWVLVAVAFVLFAIFSKKLVALLRLYRIRKIRKERIEEEEENREILSKEVEAITGAASVSTS